MTCEVGLYDWSTYGPLPAPEEAGELNHPSALSALDASAAHGARLYLWSLAHRATVATAVLP